MSFINISPKLIALLFYLCATLLYGKKFFHNTTLKPSIFIINTKAHEFVLRGGVKNSELIWTISDKEILGLSLETQLYEHQNFLLGLSYKKALREHNGHMDDYDWLKRNEGINDWSHWSTHDDTPIKNIELIDIYASETFYKSDTSQFFIIAGYKQDKFAWESYGGKYIYSSDTGFRDEKGIFNPSIKVISYEQIFKTPYLGIGGGGGLCK